MKKIFFSALAALSLVACVQEAVVDTPQGDAIAFENAFVDNATRATSLTADNLNAFRVWGFINNTTGVLFDGTKVTGGGQSWSYEGTKYWIPKQEYYFAALAPVNENGVVNATVSPASGDDAKLGLGTVNFINDGQKDLIYAQAKQTGVQSGNAPVAFTFKHLLSKVKFTFTPAMGMDEQKITAEVTDIKMTAPKTASINLAAATPVWGDHAEKVILDFGAATAGTELFAIPTAAYDYLITFTVTIKQDGEEILTVNKASTVNGLALEMGKAYNFTATINHETLNFEEIVFNVDGVEAWDTTAPNVDFVPATPVKTTLELMAAIEAGENVVLTEDINLDDLTKATPQPLVINKDITLDGNGHTLRSTAERAINVSGANEVTIKNVNIVATGERAINVIQDTKKVIIENVTATAANYTVCVAGSAPEANVVITGSELTGLNTINIAGENANVEINNTKITCDDKSTVENYAALTIHMDGKNAKINMASGEIVVNGDSNAGSAGGLNSQITIAEDKVNITGSRNIRIVKYFIDYGNNYQYAFQTFAEALAKVENGETIKLNRDVNETIEVTSDKTFTLDLNGKNITTDGDAIVVNNGATVTINGEGSNVTASSEDTASACAVWVPYGNVTINGGNYYVGSDNGRRNDCIYVGSSANKANAADYKSSVVINSGRFAAEKGDATQAYWVLNLQDAFYKAGSTITVKGGEFVGFNPANNASEGANTNFVAPGYESVENNGVWTVRFNLIDTTAELQAAIDEGQSYIKLAPGVTYEGTIVMKSNITIEGAEDAIMHCVNLFGADNVTLRKITFDATGAKMGYDNNKNKGPQAKMTANIITGDKTNSANKGAHNLVIDGCTFTGTNANNGAAIAFTDFNRGAGFSGNITIMNCTFEIDGVGGDIYAHYTGDSTNGHGNFVIKNNIFKTSGFIYLGRYASSIPVVLEGNTFEVATSLEDTFVLQDHSVENPEYAYGVSVNAINNTFAQ